MNNKKQEKEEEDESQWEDTDEDLSSEKEEEGEEEVSFEDLKEIEQLKVLEDLQKKSEVLLERMDKKEIAKMEDKVDYILETRQENMQKKCLEARKYLDFGSCGLEDFDATTIAIYLQELHYNLEIINLGSNQISDHGILDMLIGMQYHSNLKELYLGNNPLLAGTAIIGLCQVLPLFNNLRILGLGGLYIQDEGFARVSASICSLKMLSNLQIHRNQIGDDGVLSLVTVLVIGDTQLETIYLGQNENITEEGVVKLMESIVQSIGGKKLKSIHLNDIGMSPKSLQALAIALSSKGQQLEELNLGNCGIEDEGFKILANSLKENTTLQHLHLWSNFLTFDSENFNSTLQSLCIENNDIVDRELLSNISDILKQNNYFKNVLRNDDVTEKKVNPLKSNRNALETQEISSQAPKDLSSPSKPQKQQSQELKISSNNRSSQENSLIQSKHSSSLSTSHTSQSSINGSQLNKQQSSLQTSSRSIPQTSNSKITPQQTTKKALPIQTNKVKEQQNESKPLIQQKGEQQMKTQVSTSKMLNSKSTVKKLEQDSISASNKPKLINQPTKLNQQNSLKSSNSITSSTKNKQIESNAIQNKGIESKIKMQVQKQVEVQKDDNSGDSDDDLDYVPLSVNMNGQIVKRDIDNYKDFEIQEDKQKQSVNKQKNESNNQQSKDYDIENNDDDNEDNYNEDEEEEYGDDLDWLNQIQEDGEEELKMLEKLDLNLENENVDDDKIRLEYIDEFYSEEESNKQFNKMQKHIHNPFENYDPKDSNTLTWKGFFEDKTTGLLKSHLK